MLGFYFAWSLELWQTGGVRLLSRFQAPSCSFWGCGDRENTFFPSPTKCTKLAIRYWLYPFVGKKTCGFGPLVAIRPFGSAGNSGPSTSLWRVQWPTP